MDRRLMIELTKFCKEDETSQENIKSLLCIMKKAGVEAVLFEDGIMELTWKDKNIGKMQSRNAGRKEIVLDMDSVMKRKEKEKLKSIAADLGVSRMTLYRKIKEYEQSQLPTT